jgi:hypothetical protein
MYKVKSPVLLVVFNRPDPLRKVLEALKKVNPSRLYVAADGPRPGRADDIDRTAAVRELVSSIDWYGELKTRFLDHNVGCKRGVGDAISWFLDHEPEGIIIEDDVLPSVKAFQYWDWGLETFRDEHDVFLIPGMTFRAVRQSFPRRSRVVPIWGWATWRRAWAHYDPEMSGWSSNKHLVSKARFGRAAEYVYRTYDSFDPVHYDTWDIPWSWNVLENDARSIVPPFRLIDNIGFGSDATHTKGPNRHGLASKLYAGRELVLTVPETDVDPREDELYLIKQYRANHPVRAFKSLVRRFLKPTPVR